MIFIVCAAHVMEKPQFPLYKIACRYDCCRVLKQVSKAHDILRVVHDKCKQVVGLVYTKQLVCKHIGCDKVVLCMLALIKAENEQT